MPNLYFVMHCLKLRLSGPGCVTGSLSVSGGALVSSLNLLSNVAGDSCLGLGASVSSPGSVGSSGDGCLGSSGALVTNPGSVGSDGTSAHCGSLLGSQGGFSVAGG